MEAALVGLVGWGLSKTNVIIVSYSIVSQN